jgi:hypothetical protein
MATQPVSQMPPGHYCHAEPGLLEAYCAMSIRFRVVEKGGREFVKHTSAYVDF